MVTKNKKSRIEKIFERLKNKTKFNLAVRNARTILGIPIEDGFSDEIEYMDWNIKYYKKDKKIIYANYVSVVKLSVELLKEEKIDLDPGIFWEYVVDYILFGSGEKDILGEKLKSHSKSDYYGISIQTVRLLDDERIKKLKEDNPKGLMIVINPDTTKEELLKFVKNEYPKLKSFRGHKPFRIKDYHKKEDYERIYTLYKLYMNKSIKDLRKMIKSGEGQYCYDKSVAIATLLKQNNGIEISADNLRTIASRMKRRSEASQ